MVLSGEPFVLCYTNQIFIHWIECFYCLHKMHVEYINIIKAELFASSIWSCFRFDTEFYICVDVFFFLCLIHFSPECFSASIPPLETTEGPGASDRWLSQAEGTDTYWASITLFLCWQFFFVCVCLPKPVKLSTSVPTDFHLTHIKLSQRSPFHLNPALSDRVNIVGNVLQTVNQCCFHVYIHYF